VASRLHFQVGNVRGHDHTSSVLIQRERGAVYGSLYGACLFELQALANTAVKLAVHGEHELEVVRSPTGSELVEWLFLI
jgi:hypothetical protein